MINVYTGGTFDCFHHGHVNFLLNASLLGNRLIVALNTDEFIKRFKRVPVFTYEERYFVVEACRYVDIVIPNIGNENTGITIDYVNKLLKKYSNEKINKIAIGDDWKEKDYLGQLGIDQKFLDEREIELIYIPYTKGISTTEIIERFKNG